jgi:trehalose-6-phosphate synthase
MPRSERRQRMRALRARVVEHDVARWSQDFRDALAAIRPSASTRELAATD